VAGSLYHLTFSSDIKLFDNPAAMPLFSCREKLRRLLKQEGFCSGSVAVCYAVGSLFPEEALALQVGDLRGKFRKECQTGGNPQHGELKRPGLIPEFVASQIKTRFRSRTFPPMARTNAYAK
jgi:hypothetical protein